MAGDAGIEADLDLGDAGFYAGADAEGAGDVPGQGPEHPGRGAEDLEAVSGGAGDRHPGAVDRGLAGDGAQHDLVPGAHEPRQGRLDHETLGDLEPGLAVTEAMVLRHGEGGEAKLREIVGGDEIEAHLAMVVRAQAGFPEGAGEEVFARFLAALADAFTATADQETFLGDLVLGEPEVVVEQGVVGGDPVGTPRVEVFEGVGHRPGAESQNRLVDGHYGEVGTDERFPAGEHDDLSGDTLPRFDLRHPEEGLDLDLQVGPADLEVDLAEPLGGETAGAGGADEVYRGVGVGEVVGLDRQLDLGRVVIEIDDELVDDTVGLDTDPGASREGRLEGERRGFTHHVILFVGGDTEALIVVDRVGCGCRTGDGGGHADARGTALEEARHDHVAAGLAADIHVVRRAVFGDAGVHDGYLEVLIEIAVAEEAVGDLLFYGAGLDAIDAGLDGHAMGGCVLRVAGGEGDCEAGFRVLVVGREADRKDVIRGLYRAVESVGDGLPFG